MKADVTQCDRGPPGASHYHIRSSPSAAKREAEAWNRKHQFTFIAALAPTKEAISCNDGVCMSVAEWEYRRVRV